MIVTQKAITGKETHTEDEKINALIDFYTAFNTRDFTRMQNNWYNHEEIAMDNPLGDIKRGWDEIKSIYQRIFSGQAKVYVEFFDYSIIEMEGGFCAIGRERGSVQVGDKKLDLAIRTSRVYKRIKGSYQQVHHHGSIESPELLKEYQELVH